MRGVQVGQRVGRRRAVAAVAAGLAMAGALAGAQAAQAGGVVYTTPGQHPWTVPSGVTKLRVIIVGGAGGKGAGAPGGAGAQVVADVVVNPGQPLIAGVGALGQDAGQAQLPAGVPGGATSGGAGGTGLSRLGGAGGWGWLTGTYATNAGGGGGGSASALSAGVAGYPTLDLVVAGAGGGAGTLNAGGDGGRPSGFRGAGTLAGGGGANRTHGAPGGATGAAGSDDAGPGGAGGSPLPGDHGGGGGGGGGGYGSGGGGAVSNAATLGSGGGGGGSFGPAGATFSRAVSGTTPVKPFVWLTWTDPTDTVAPVSKASPRPYSNTKRFAVSYDVSDAAWSSGVARISLWVKGPKDAGFVQVGAPITNPAASGAFDVSADEGDGTYQFATRAVDNAGNDEGVPTGPDMVVPVDTVAPTISWTGNAGTYDVDQPIWIHCDANDPAPSMGLVVISCDGVDPSATSYGFGLGPHLLNAVAHDRAGNITSRTTAFVVIATPGGVGRLLAKLVKASGNYKGMTVSQQSYVDAVDTALAGTLTASPRRVADFQRGVDSLAGGGFLTTRQATDLKNLASGL
ncbi:MAG: hypothetical protein QOG11_1127 [Solirubrobacteraceae bacterium]|nr:hypothetical protein [Solirubrobacteraceae bacterium]